MFTRAAFLLKRLDWGFVITVLALVASGVAFIYSASYRNETALTALTQRQIMWALVGLGLFLLVVLADYHRASDTAWVVYAVCLVLLVLVLAVMLPIVSMNQLIR